MPTKNGEPLSTGTLYLQDKDGNMTPFMSLAEAALHGCTEGTINFVDDIPVIQEITFTIPRKCLTRAQLRALKRLKWSRKALERPMRRIKRQKEKARRYTIKHGIDKKIIAHFKKYMEEHRDEEFSH